MIRTLLLNIRKLSARLNDLQKLFILGIALVLVATGVLVDIFLPFEFWINFFRMVIALAVALVLFSEIYLFLINRMQLKINRDEPYTPIRDKFTFRERRNISIFMWAGLFIAILFTSGHSPMYTFFASLIMMGALAILTFVRANRDEYMRDKYGIPDKRDVDFDVIVKDNLEKRHKQWAEKDKKHKSKKESPKEE